MTDPDNLLVCSWCLHDARLHGCDGCLSRDDLDNRCACIWTGEL